MIENSKKTDSSGFSSQVYQIVLHRTPRKLIFQKLEQILEILLIECSYFPKRPMTENGITNNCFLRILSHISIAKTPEITCPKKKEDDTHCDLLRGDDKRTL